MRGGRPVTRKERPDSAKEPPVENEGRSDERRDGEFADGNGAAEARTDRWRRRDARIIAGPVESNLAVDDNAHAIDPDLPRDVAPLRRTARPPRLQD